LDARLTEIEKRHNLDAKNAALLRNMAVKRFSKYKKSSGRGRVSLEILVYGYYLNIYYNF
jgi:hypothetical protein